MIRLLYCTPRSTKHTNNSQTHWNQSNCTPTYTHFTHAHRQFISTPFVIILQFKRAKCVHCGVKSAVQRLCGGLVMPEVNFLIAPPPHTQSPFLDYLSLLIHNVWIPTLWLGDTFHTPVPIINTFTTYRSSILEQAVQQGGFRALYKNFIIGCPSKNHQVVFLSRGKQSRLP